MLIKEIYSRPAWRLLAILPLVLFMVSVFYPSTNKSWYFLSIMVIYLIAGACYFYKWRTRSIIPALGLVDVIFIGLLGYELVNYYTSTYPPNTFFYLEKICSYGIFYFLVKLYPNQKQLVAMLIMLATIIAFLLALINVKYYFLFYNTNRSLSDLANYKHLYKPLGINSNDLGTIFLCFLPFPAWCLFKYKNVFARCFFAFTITLILFGILTTFSRGVYIALGVWLIGLLLLLYFFKALTRTQTVKLFCFFLVVLLIAFAPVHKPASTTLALDKTLSQKLSTEGRKELYQAGFRIFKTSPVTGIGSGNFPLKYAVYKRQSEDVKFNANVTNAYLLILIEKGVTGFALYASLLTIVIVNAFRKLNSRDDTASKTALIIFLTSLIAILVRDLFYASILVNDYTLFLCILILYVCGHHSHDRSLLPLNKSTAGKACLLLLLLALTTTWLFTGRYIAREYYGRGIVLYKRSAYKASLLNFQKAISYDAGNAICHAYAALAIIKNSNTSVSIEDAMKTTSQVSASSGAAIDSAIRYYLQAILLNEDDLLIHNVGWLYFLKRENDQATAFFSKAVRIDPTIALYHISLGLVKEKDGQWDQALQEYANAIRLSPDLLDSDFFKFLETRSPGMATKVLAQAQHGLEVFLANHPDIKIKAKLAKVYLSNGGDEKAYALLREVTESLPNLNRPHFYLGDLYAQKGDTAQMLKCYRLGAKTDPADFLADIKWGNYYKVKNDTAKARSYFNAGYYKWSTIFPEYAIKTALMYRLKTSIHNAIIPQDMLQYIKSYRHL